MKNWIYFLGIMLAISGCAKLQPTAEGQNANNSNTQNGGSASGGCAPSLRGGASNCPLSLSANVTTFAGPLQGSTNYGDTNATGTGAGFYQPFGITTDGINLYVADSTNNKIRKIVISTRAVSNLAGPDAGCTPSCGWDDTDGTGSAARFRSPRGIVSYGNYLYVADTSNNQIRRITIDTGLVTTIAGNAQGDADGTGNSARFFSPSGIATDGANLYVTESDNHKIRKIVISTGVVTTLAGPAAGTNGCPASCPSGNTDGVGANARFDSPFGITTDGANLYVADSNNRLIRKIIISTGVVSTIGTTANFAGWPYGITTDGTSLFVTQRSAAQNVRVIPISTGIATTLAGAEDSTFGSLDGIGTAARFYEAYGVTTDGTSLFIADTWNNKIRKIQ